MGTVLLEQQENIAILRLSNGITNAIGPQLVNDLGAALIECRNDCRGLILAGGAKFFIFKLAVQSGLVCCRSL